MSVLSVLYVDDDPDIREIVALSLSLDPGFQVHTAGSGRLALDLLDQGLTPDVILTDVMMPDLDGPATLAAVRERPPLDQTPVIFITARALESERDRFLALGAHGVISKPFDPVALARQVRELLGAA